MFTFIVGFKEGNVEELTANDMLTLLNELEQKGSRYNISFVFNKADEILLMNYYYNRRTK